MLFELKCFRFYYRFERNHKLLTEKKMLSQKALQHACNTFATVLQHASNHKNRLRCNK